MAGEPVDMIMPMLGEMRSEIKTELVEIRGRLELVEREIRNVHKALLADTLMSRLVASDFDGRISAIEKNVEELMKGA